jgi:hypothetical protein
MSRIVTGSKSLLFPIRTDFWNYVNERHILNISCSTPALRGVGRDVEACR